MILKLKFNFFAASEVLKPINLWFQPMPYVSWFYWLYSGYFQQFGKGIYFADMSSKSANYCFATHSRNTGLLMLCEVFWAFIFLVDYVSYSFDRLLCFYYIYIVSLVVRIRFERFCWMDGIVLNLLLLDYHYLIFGLW